MVCFRSFQGLDELFPVKTDTKKDIQETPTEVPKFTDEDLKQYDYGPSTSIPDERTKKIDEKIRKIKEDIDRDINEIEKRKQAYWCNKGILLGLR